MEEKMLMVKEKTMEYRVYTNDTRLREYIYKDITPRALEIAHKYNLDNETFNLYNFLCRGDFCFENGDGDMYFNSSSNGIGWSHDREWVKVKLKSLIKDGIVSFKSIPAPRDGRYRVWYFWDSRFELNRLVRGGCFVTNWKMFEIKRHLGLDDGWTSRDFSFSHNGYDIVSIGDIFTVEKDGKKMQMSKKLDFILNMGNGDIHNMATFLGIEE